MEINNKKKRLSHIIVFFSMLLFAVCLTVNVLFCSTYHLYELLDKTTVIETWKVSKSIAANEDGDNTFFFKSPFLNNNHPYDETITNKIFPIFMAAAIPKGISLLLFLIAAFLFLFLTLFILLPDRWTLINQKVRLDN